MVESQLVPRGIKDPRVLEAMRKVPRHLFVQETQRGSAYEDYPLPIGEGQTISQPYMVALMTEALNLTGEESVLEVGTGSGYQTAVLAELACKVYSVERIPSLTGQARKTLDSLGYKNVLVRLSDGTLGWPEYAPFDRIIVTAGAPSIPEPLVEQLVEDGILVVPVGSSLSQELIQLTRYRDGSIRKRKLGGCVFVRLVGKHGWEVNGR
ncbi:MAG: protein-L-isoaspartate(D-aspartate) O-methyltransferase [Deltaproteobacteria bacterium]|nr:protein-L-isoaspartate(D-aspartate) O-methyltransferase [Deltaproteobacteria bacterium]